MGLCALSLTFARSICSNILACSFMRWTLLLPTSMPFAAFASSARSSLLLPLRTSCAVRSAITADVAFFQLPLIPLLLVAANGLTLGASPSEGGGSGAPKGTTVDVCIGRDRWGWACQ